MWRWLRSAAWPTDVETLGLMHQTHGGWWRRQSILQTGCRQHFALPVLRKLVLRIDLPLPSDRSRRRPPRAPFRVKAPSRDFPSCGLMRKVAVFPAFVPNAHRRAFQYGCISLGEGRRMVGLAPIA